MLAWCLILSWFSCTWIFSWCDLSLPCFHEIQICVICKQIHGSCTQCCKCSTYYHAMCASRAGYRMEVRCSLLSICNNIFGLKYCSLKSTSSQKEVSWIQSCRIPFCRHTFLSLYLIIFCEPEVHFGESSGIDGKKEKLEKACQSLVTKLVRLWWCYWCYYVFLLIVSFSVCIQYFG